MSSLKAHLREPGDHGRLAFHPECPVCRDDRVFGELPRDAIVGRRTQALLTAGVLAVSSAAPTAAFGAPSDQEREGTAAPEESTADPAGDPDFDPGGESTDLPFDVGPPQEAAPLPDPEADTGPLEQEPVTDEDAPMADGGDQAGAPGPEGQPAPPRPGTAAPPPSTPPPLPATSQTPVAAQPAPVPVAPTATPSASGLQAEVPARGRTRVKPAQRRQPSTGLPSEAISPAPAPEPALVRHPAPVTTTTQPSESTATYIAEQAWTSSSASDGDHRPATASDRFHVVRPGESLWSIAGDLLGRHASLARIAREVNRLWELNSDRIGTGDPDLLRVGTKLALR
jgi:hypothetical protein